jgi:hypothetical protein
MHAFTPIVLLLSLAAGSLAGAIDIDKRQSCKELYGDYEPYTGPCEDTSTFSIYF